MDNTFLQTKTTSSVSTRLKVAAAGSLVLLGGLMAFFTYPFAHPKVCSQLKEQACYQRIDCQGVYTQDSHFSFCQSLDAAQLEQIVTAYDACERTQGVWQKNTYGMFCSCEAIHKQFVIGQGCQ